MVKVGTLNVDRVGCYIWDRVGCYTMVNRKAYTLLCVKETMWKGGARNIGHGFKLFHHA